MKEERKHKRAPLTAHVELVVGVSEPPLIRSGMIADISLNGVGLYLFFPVEIGVRVKLEIRFLVVGGIMTETVKGKTVYSYPVQDTYYVGIQFDQELDPIQQPELYNRIQHILGSF